MDTETKDMMLKYLQASADRIERGAAFVEGEIPLVVTEYLNWYWYYYFIGLVFGAGSFVLSGVCWLGIAKLCHMASKDKDLDSEDWFIGSFALCVLLGIGFGIAGVWSTISNTMQLVKVSVAPRVVLLEKIAEIAK